MFVCVRVSVCMCDSFFWGVVFCCWILLIFFYCMYICVHGVDVSVCSVWVCMCVCECVQCVGFVCVCDSLGFFNSILLLGFFVFCFYCMYVYAWGWCVCVCMCM